jgi:hypothetical protein
MSTIPTDAVITAYIAARPWLKMLLTFAMALLGTAKGRGWFWKKYGPDVQ